MIENMNGRSDKMLKVRHFLRGDQDRWLGMQSKVLLILTRE